MPRPYSEPFLIELFQRQDDEIGTRLAKACVSNNLPITYVAPVLGVTRMSVHSWFHGIKPKQAKIEMIEAFIKLVNEDTGTRLPAKSLVDAKEYLASLTAVPA